jgi:hypothetical protein
MNMPQDYPSKSLPYFPTWIFLDGNQNMLFLDLRTSKRHHNLVLSREHVDTQFPASYGIFNDTPRPGIFGGISIDKRIGILLCLIYTSIVVSQPRSPMLSAYKNRPSNERCSCGGLQILVQSWSASESRLTKMEVVVLSITNSNQEHNSMNNGYPEYQHLSS